MCLTSKTIIFDDAVRATRALTFRLLLALGACIEFVTLDSNFVVWHIFGTLQCLKCHLSSKEGSRILKKSCCNGT